jgi:hypothetical protein
MKDAGARSRPPSMKRYRLYQVAESAGGKPEKRGAFTLHYPVTLGLVGTSKSPQEPLLFR